jgi:membrane protease YdiL (CAAX protease family)
MEFIIGLLYVGGVIYLANQDDLRREIGAPMRGDVAASALLPWMLYGLVAIASLFAVMILYLAYAPDMAAAMEELGLPPIQIDRTAAVINLALAVVLGGLSAAVINSMRVRVWVQQIVTGFYNPLSSVHTTALVLALLAVSVFFGQFVQQGGQAGLVEALRDSNSLVASSVIFDAILRVVIAFLGVGLAIRRTLPQSLARLGLRLPTRDDIRWGIGGGVAIYVSFLITATIWVALVSPEQFEEQTNAASQIAQMFNTLPLALILAVSAAVGEEILFRGALQPVFGWIPTSILFALLHIQYTLTPATLIIFVVSLGLGWVRMRQSTTAAIIAHFLYDFVPLALQVAAGGSMSAQ